MSEDITQKETPQEILDKVNARLAKRYKKQDKSMIPFMRMASELPEIDFIPTGLLAYDWVNGGGGPKGKIEQIYGKRSSGKTTLVLRRIAEAQRLGLTCAFIDSEHELDREWAIKIGVDINRLILHIPDMEPGEITMGIVEEMLLSDDIDLIALDSINSLGTKAMLDKDVGDKHYGGVSLLMESFYKKVVGSGLLYYSDSILIFINQPREVIGSRFPMDRLPGGRALQHMSAIITEVKQGDFLMRGSGEDEEKVGIEIKIVNKKNKVRWPFRENTVRLQFDRGFNPVWEVVHFGKRYGIIESKAAWGYYNGEKLGQGDNQQMEFLIDNAEIYYEIKQKIVERLKSGK